MTMGLLLVRRKGLQFLSPDKERDAWKAERGLKNKPRILRISGLFFFFTLLLLI